MLVDPSYPTQTDLPSRETPIFSIGDFSRLLQNTIADHFSNIRLKGEISGLKIHSSGHVYFSLKDTDAVLDAICWKGNATRLKDALVEGLEVICRGRITTYPLRSKYQIIVDSMETAGIGSLLKVLEERKKRLLEEGLFEAARKLTLPFLPRRLGIITSPTGAVIRDILHRLEERMPTHVLLWPVTVQGDRAAPEILEALRGFHLLSPTDRPDAIIVARGGGSIEDLWCFNDENIVRAVASSEIPIISAIGHETDVTLIDYAASKRAPTPTAAAEMAVPVRADLLALLAQQEGRLATSLLRHLKETRLSLASFSRALATPRTIIERYMQTLDDRTSRLEFAMKTRTIRCQQILSPLTERFPRALDQLQKEWAARLTQASHLIESFSYENILRRGFVLVTRDEKLVTHAHDLKAGNQVTLIYHDGKRHAIME